MQTITAAKDLSPEILLALEAGVGQTLKDIVKSSGDIKDRTAPNQSFRNVTINLVLTLDEVLIGADTDKTPTSSIPLLAVMALLVKRMGFQRDQALATLKEVMLQALALDKGATDALLEEAGVAEAETLVKNEVIAKLPRTKVKKAVRVKGASLTVTGLSKSL